MKSPIKEAYNPSSFREKGHRLVDRLADYLEDVIHNDETPVFKSFKPEKLFQEWKQGIEGGGSGDFDSWSEKVLADSIHLHSPAYMGHQVSPVLPEAVLADFMGSLLNNGVGVYEMGSPAVAMERSVIKQLARQLGFGEQADGILTSGGTLGNLTAMLAARQVKAGIDVWNGGQEGRRFGVMVSEEAHYSVVRAVKIMGWGEQGIIKVPADESHKMNPGKLEVCYRQALADGIEVLAVVGSSCSTATGAYDPLPAIADFCEKHDLWLHVDAAHGGGAAYSDEYRHLLEGIERADSVIVDFHKMLMCPALVTGLVFKNGDQSYQTFAQKASYLWAKEDKEWYNLGKRTFECTKDMMALKVYAVLQTHGPELFAHVVERLFGMGKTFAGKIKQRSGFELLTEPDCNIVCFRFIRPDVDDERLNGLNQSIRDRLLADGRYFIVQASIGGKLYLRTTLMNVFTEPDHLEGLLEEIEQIAGEIV